jgi:folate-dependent phosphoribosylglycinamide formyltransferase PurN
MNSIKTAIFISGGGTNMSAVVKSSQTGILNGLIQPAIIIASNPNAGGIQKAKDLGIPVEIIKFGKDTKISPEGQILRILEKYQIELCVLAGWIKLIPEGVVKRYENKIINIHPAPLDPGFPDFGGKGMFSFAPHIAVIIFAIITGKLNFSESTVHIVNAHFDKGQIINKRQVALPKLSKQMSFSEIEENSNLIIDLAKQLQESLFPIEHENLIQSLYEISSNGLDSIKTINRDERLIDSQDLKIIEKAKELAIKLSNSL